MEETLPPTGLTTLPFTAHPFRTDRLLLRPLTEADTNDVFAYQSRPDVVGFLPWPLRTLEESREHTVKRAGLTRLEKDDDALIFAMELVGSTADETDGRGPVIGDLTVILSSAENAQVEIGWVLHPDYQKQGYASEAARALLDLVFEEIGAHRVTARVSPENVPSVALCSRLGMRLEAHFEECEIFKGEWSDLAIYALLRREWTPGPWPGW
ncbi:GNAT family N-acetyltransferase [Glaciibacter sp. 2TAF33]|uniref:GNAT family N-acetyltransferase n=1 Tax=Glaciibacter sp. 2TAF33 TaxID=3233015 RepID=UPI003F8DAC00